MKVLLQQKYVVTTVSWRNLKSVVLIMVTMVTTCDCHSLTEFLQR